MDTRDMIIEMLVNNIVSMEKDIENLRMILADKIEQLEKYHNLLNNLEERG